jgi:hypothetical protein
MVVILAAMMSNAATAVLVKSEVVVECTLVPVEIATPEVLIESEEVGIAVPVAFRQNFTVAVPASTLMSQPVIVQA